MRKTRIVMLALLSLNLLSCGNSKFSEEAAPPGSFGRAPSSFVAVPYQCTGGKQGSIIGVWKLSEKMNTISHEYTVTITEKQTQLQTTCFYGGAPVTASVTSSSSYDSQRYTIDTTVNQSVPTANKNLSCLASLGKGTHLYSVTGNCLKINDGKIRIFHRQ